MVVSVETDYEGKETFALVEKIRDTIEVYYPGTDYLAGEGVSTYDLMDTITVDMVKVNLIAIGAVFVVLMFSMKSLILPFILAQIGLLMGRETLLSLIVVFFVLPGLLYLFDGLIQKAMLGINFYKSKY